MNRMETKQLMDNELIAEFMGLPLTKQLPQFSSVGPKKWTTVPFQDWKYHSSWDWLMPVVEKISQHIYESYPDHNGYKEVTVHDRAYPRTFGMIDNDGKWMVRINRMPLEQEETLMQATYKAVVEWIKSNQPQKAS